MHNFSILFSIPYIFVAIILAKINWLFGISVMQVMWWMIVLVIGRIMMIGILLRLLMIMMDSLWRLIMMMVMMILWRLYISAWTDADWRNQTGNVARTIAAWVLSARTGFSLFSKLQDPDGKTEQESRLHGGGRFEVRIG